MPLGHRLGRAVLGHRDGGGQGAAAEGGQIDADDQVPPDAQRGGHPPGRLQLEAVPLAVIDRERVEREAFLPGDGRGGGRIQPPGKQDHRRPLG